MISQRGAAVIQCTGLDAVTSRPCNTCERGRQIIDRRVAVSDEQHASAGRARKLATGIAPQAELG